MDTVVAYAEAPFLSIKGQLALTDKALQVCCLGTIIFLSEWGGLSTEL